MFGMALHVVDRRSRFTWNEHTTDSAEYRANPPIFECADSVRHALDGLELSICGRSWRVEVFTVAEISSRRYVQVALRGTADHFVTLRLHTGCPAERLVPALLSWLAHPAPAGHIVDVA